MVEIFTLAAGKQGDAARTVSDAIQLDTPSDVYFGAGVAGIAYYEKSGADLRVTLLDGQEVLIRDFFVIGPGGEFSRLMDGGAHGDVEVTGLIAPEPFLPPDSAVAEAEPAPATPSAAEETVVQVETGQAETAAPISQGSDEEVIEVDVVGTGDGPDGLIAAGGVSHGGGFLGGLTADRAVFLGALLPVGLTVFQDGSGETDSAGAKTAAAETPTETAAETGTDAGTDAGMDSDIALMLTVIDAGAGSASGVETTALGESPVADSAFDAGAVDGSDLGALSSFFDMLATAAVEG